MGAGTTTVDSNISGLAVAEEVLTTPTVLPGTPVWYPLEPNSYSDFGGTVKGTRREPISATRQKRKGTNTGLDVAAGFSHDFVTKTLYPLMQGFMFASWREKDNLLPSAVSATVYTVASGGAAFVATSLLYAEGFAVAGNNGLKNVTSSTGTTVTATGGLTIEASPPAGATITRVGFQGASADLAVTVASGIATLTSVVLDFSLLGLIPGEWLFIGGDSAAFVFGTASANGWYRINTVAAHAIVFDRAPDSVAADAGTGKTIRVFLGHVIKNEALASLQKFRTYQFERSFGSAKFQYEKGCGANTLAMNVKANDKVMVDMGFVGMSEETTVTAKTGTRPALPKEEVFNSATSFSRLRLHNDTTGVDLAVLITDLKISIDNGVKGVEAITNTLGKVDLSSGDFTVSGSVEAYFSSFLAVDAVKLNPDASIDFAMVENVSGIATGWLFDTPLVQVGDARLKVEKDKPVMLPISLMAAGHNTLNHTLLVMRFAYLPQLAL